MKLRFLARAQSKVRELGVHRYYGREPSPPFAVTKEGVELSEGADADRCARACREGDMYAADAETARFARVELVSTEFRDGDHVAVPSKAAKSEKGGS